MGKRLSVSERLRAALAKCPEPLRALSKRIKVTHTVLSRFAAGGNMELRSADKLADALGLELKPREGGKS